VEIESQGGKKNKKEATPAVRLNDSVGTAHQADRDVAVHLHNSRVAVAESSLFPQSRHCRTMCAVAMCQVWWKFSRSIAVDGWQASNRSCLLLARDPCVSSSSHRTHTRLATFTYTATRVFRETKLAPYLIRKCRHNTRPLPNSSLGPDPTNKASLTD
jgi:hypothetical protein